MSIQVTNRHTSMIVGGRTVRLYGSTRSRFRAWPISGGSAVEGFGVVADDLALGHVDDVFGDVGGVVSDAFEVA